jgi:hypothetical protein
MFLRCQLQFQYRYLDGQIRPPGVALLVGSTVHKAAEVNLIAKRDNGAQLAQGDVADFASMEFDRQWSAGGEVDLDDEERAKGPAAVKGEAKDQSVQLAVLHATDLTPHLAPLHVERSVRVAIPGLRHELEGTFDLQTNDGKLHDLKTSSKKLGADAITDSVQMRLYSVLAEVADGKKPNGLALDVLQKNKKPLAYVVESPTFSSSKPILDLIARVERVVETGVFAPAEPTSWVCRKSYCGWWDTCPFGRASRVTL